MLSRLKFLIALILLGCAAAAHADPPGRVGRLNLISGEVSFASAETQDEWARPAVNRPLTNGDRLWVERDGRAEFHVGSIAVRLAGYTAVDVLNLDDDRLQLRLSEGTINVRVRELDREDVIEVATPTAAVLLREPGSYRVSVDSQQDAARVTVNFGRAEVITPARSFDVPSTQAAVIAAGAAPSFEVAASVPPGEFDRWAAERDRREDRAVSAKYVSRQMTGYEDLDDHGSWQSIPEYGHVWVPAHVPAGWAPYRQGHWTWISPWGWTWIDDAPWGFAPFHYGRWVWLDRHWAWAPGPIVRRPVYAPALVAFVGGSGWSVSVARGPAVGWFPLGWREPFVPWYRASNRHVHNVNVTHVTNVTNVRNITYVNRGRPEAVTVVSQQAFVSSRPAWQERHSVGREELARAQVIRDRAPADPVRASFTSAQSGQPGRRPPAELRTREVLGVSPPAVVTRERGAASESRSSAAPEARTDSPPVRILSRDRGEQGVAASGPATRAPQPGGSVDNRPARRFDNDPRREDRRDDRRDGRSVSAGDAPRTSDNEARVREQREQRLQQQAPRGQSPQAQAPQIQSAPRSQPPQAQAPQIQPAPRSQPPQAPAPQIQSAPRQSQPPQAQAPQAQSPQAQAQAPRSQSTQARQQPNEDGNRGERRSQRQTPRDRD